MAAEEPTIGQRIWRMADAIAHPIATTGVIARRLSVAALDFGSRLTERYDAFSGHDALGPQIVHRFEASASTGSDAELPLSIPPRASHPEAPAQWSGPRWPTTPAAPTIARTPAPVVARLPQAATPLQRTEMPQGPLNRAADEGPVPDNMALHTTAPSDYVSPDSSISSESAPATISRSADMPPAVPTSAAPAANSTESYTVPAEGSSTPETQLPAISAAPTAAPAAPGPLPLVARRTAEAAAPPSAESAGPSPRASGTPFPSVGEGPGVRGPMEGTTVPADAPADLPQTPSTIPQPGEALRTADLTMLQPTTLRPTTLMRSLPTDPLDRMGLARDITNTSAAATARDVPSALGESVQQVARSTDLSVAGMPVAAEVATLGTAPAVPASARQPAVPIAQREPAPTVTQPASGTPVIERQLVQAAGELSPPVAEHAAPVETFRSVPSAAIAREVEPAPMAQPPEAPATQEAQDQPDIVAAPETAHAGQQPDSAGVSVPSTMPDLVWREPTTDLADSDINPLPTAPLPYTNPQGDTSAAAQADRAAEASEPADTPAQLPVVTPVESSSVARDFAELPLATGRDVGQAYPVEGDAEAGSMPLQTVLPSDSAVPPVASTPLQRTSEQSLPLLQPARLESQQPIHPALASNIPLQQTPQPIARQVALFESAVQRIASPTLFDPVWQPRASSEIARTEGATLGITTDLPQPAMPAVQAPGWGNAPAEGVNSDAWSMASRDSLPFAPTVAGEIRRIQTEHPQIARQLGLPSAFESLPAGPGAHADQPIPALDLARSPAADIGRLVNSVQRATEADPATAPATASAGNTPGGVQNPAPTAQPTIEQIARQVYEHLRRRLLIDQERLGRIR